MGLQSTIFLTMVKKNLFKKVPIYLSKGTKEVGGELHGNLGKEPLKEGRSQCQTLDTE